MNRALVIIVSCIALTSFAQGKDAHKHGDEHKPKRAGQAEESVRFTLK